ncbi:hypothetical protein [Caproicibacter fermentans]|nr:hypothetical protein [Caproicibacter fermentans]
MNLRTAGIADFAQERMMGMEVLWNFCPGQPAPHGEKPGKPISVDWSFSYDGLQYRIPRVYRFREGIVFDAVAVLNRAAARAFYDRYRDKEAGMSLEDIEFARATSPLPEILPLKEFYVNGRKVGSGWRGQGRPYFPWDPHDGGELLPLIEENEFLKDACFAWTRCRVPFPAFYMLKTLKIRLHETCKALPVGVCFSLPVGKEAAGREIEFVHPVTGNAHRLIVESLEGTDLNLVFHSMTSSRHRYCPLLRYVIDPPLPETDKLEVRQEGSQMCSSAGGAIGVIGGADGPTAVFFGDPLFGPRGLPVRQVFLSPAESIPEQVRIRIPFLNVPKNPETEIVLSL